MEKSIIIDSILEENDLYQKWSSKLLAFGAQGRADYLAPPESSLSDSDRAMQKISREAASFFPDRYLPIRERKLFSVYSVTCMIKK